MNSNRRRGGKGGGPRHLRKNHSFGSSGSNSSDWRQGVSAKEKGTSQDVDVKNQNNVVNESNSYGYNNHHLTSAFLMLVGLPVKIQKTDGSIYEGILETVSNKLEFHLYHVSSKNGNGSTDSSDETMYKAMFQFCDIVYCRAAEVDLNFAKKGELLTDSAISGNNGPIERELVQWVAPQHDGLHQNVELDDLDMSCNGLPFEDMVRINEKHGVKSNFDHSMSSYMTPLEKRDDEEYREQERIAERMAREISKDSRSRELDAADSGIGEEEMFSSVIRSSSTKQETTSGSSTENSNTAHASNQNNSTVQSTNNSHTTSNNSALKNNNALHSSNENLSSNNNDGFTTYTKYRSRGGKNNSNTVGPRLQRKHQEQQQQQHQNGGNSYGNSRVPPRAQNGNSNRGTSYHHSHSSHNNNSGMMSSSHQQHNNTSSQQMRQQHQQHAEIQQQQQQQQSARPVMSYSAVAMKKQTVSGNNRVVTPVQNTQQVVNTQQAVPPQPQASPPKKPAENSPLLPAASIPKAVPSPLQTTIPDQEAINAAKKEYLQKLHEPRSYALKTQAGLQNQPTALLPQPTSPRVTIAHAQSTAHATTAGQLPNQHIVATKSESTPQSQQTMLNNRPLAEAPAGHEKLPQRNLEKKDMVPLDQKKDIMMPLSKFGKVHQNEERKPSANLDNLKEFHEGFKLDVKSTKGGDHTRPKTHDERHKPTDATSSSSSQSIATSSAEIKSVAASTSHDVISTQVNTTVTSSSTTSALRKTSQPSTSQPSTLTTTSTSTTSTSSTSEIGEQQKKSALDPTAKEFTFNPSAKEFTPVPSPKPPLAKQSSYSSNPEVVVMPQHAPRPAYYPAHSVTMAAANHAAAADIMAAQQQPVVNKTYRYPNGHVYTIPAAPTGTEYANSNTNHPMVTPHAGFINQGAIHHAQPQFVLVQSGTGGTVYQQVVGHPNQPYLPMQGAQPSMIRYVTSQPQANAAAVQAQQQARFPNFQDAAGVHNGYVIAVSQHGGAMQHQNVASNNFTAPSPSPSPHLQQQQQQQQQQATNSQHAQQQGSQPQQQYIMSHSNYPQIASPHNPAAAVYRTATSIHSISTPHHHPQSQQQQQQQQQSFMMMQQHAAHHGGQQTHPHHHPHAHHMQPNQAFMQGQPHAGILPTYPSGN